MPFLGVGEILEKMYGEHVYIYICSVPDTKRLMIWQLENTVHFPLSSTSEVSCQYFSLHVLY